NYIDEQNLTHFFDVGRSGSAHVLLAELGYVVPGDVFVGADSHTCNHGALGAFSTGVGSSDLAAAMALGRLWLRVPESMKFVFHGRPRPWVTGKDLILKVIGEIGVDGARYGAMEFCGDTLTHLTMDERFSITNMAVEAGAKNGIMEADDVVLEWIRPRARRAITVYRSDPGASYVDVREVDVSTLDPVVSAPASPGNVVSVREVGGVKVDQCFIGTCTNGRSGDTPPARAARRWRANSCIPRRSCATRCQSKTAMAIRGKAHTVGHHIDTDVIIPARYLVTTDPAELAKYVFEDLDPSLRQRIAPGDVLVAGENFGQGSSREHAPIAIKGVGISCIVAVSFARIFYRNAFNIGLPVVECQDVQARVSEGDELDVDLATGVIRNVTRGEAYKGTPVPEFMLRLLTAGGIVGYVRAELARERQ